MSSLSRLSVIFIVDRIDDTIVITNGCEFDIPVGSVFTAMGKYKCEPPNYESIDLGIFASTHLIVKEVEVYRRKIEVIPRGWSAGIVLEGDGMDKLESALGSVGKHDGLYLIVEEN